jgi:hypothetical protein
MSGFFLLRHDGRAGGEGVGELDEFEFPAAPEDHFLGKAGKVHHYYRQRGEQLNAEVPVGDAVQAVARNIGKAQRGRFHVPVGVVGGARQRAAADGRGVHALRGVGQPPDVPEEHHGVGHQVVAEGDGLGPLQMGVARHDDGLVLLRLFARTDRSALSSSDGLPRLPPQVHPQVERHLIVAAAGRVQHLALVADAGGEHALHEHVYVLAVGVELKRAGGKVVQYPLQPVDDVLRRGLRDDAFGAQHGGVGHGARDILRVHAAVEADGGVEIVRQLIGFSGGSAGPHFFHCQSLPLNSARPPLSG